MITFNRVNLCDKDYPLYAYQPVVTRKEDILEDMKTVYFEMFGNQYHSLRITKNRQGNGWILRASFMESTCRLEEIASGFKTKKEAVEYVNAHINQVAGF